MRKERIMWILIILTLIALLAIALPVRASDGLPEGVYVFEAGGRTCVLAENNLECFCPCEAVYNECPIDAPCPKQEPCPECQDCKDCKQCQECPKEKECREKSNSGRGNGSEGSPDKDPGNSGKNQGGD